MQVNGLPPCPFCSRKELAVIFESAKFLAIYNKFPVVPGHCLLVPKRHVEAYLCLDPSELADLTGASRRLIEAAISAHNTSSFDYALQEGVAAGGTIPHLHFHVIPRRSADLSRPDEWYPELLRQQIEPSLRERVELTMEAMSIESDRIKKMLANEPDLS